MAITSFWATLGPSILSPTLYLAPTGSGNPQRVQGSANPPSPEQQRSLVGQKDPPVRQRCQGHGAGVGVAVGEEASRGGGERGMGKVLGWQLSYPLNA